jgi:hypothetical protein
MNPDMSGGIFGGNGQKTTLKLESSGCPRESEKKPVPKDRQGVFREARGGAMPSNGTDGFPSSKRENVQCVEFKGKVEDGARE